ncbi:MAG: hypothetical protein RBG13Loki_4076 [Promethearchaeota archaeon CR_4]|nr:MAG: hypothetical protein RBG13Loki_4076 [Candidatus Lokiarchaeota archaeon CR_4]
MPEESLLYGVVFSIFDDEGPSPRFVWPENLDYGWQLQISMKTISLLMGERTYQDGDKFEEVRYYGILPFPDFGLEALSFFFLLRDETARGQAKAATITLLTREKTRDFLYEDMPFLQSVINSTAAQIMDNHQEADYTTALKKLIVDIQTHLKQKASPFAGGRKYKLLFTGLDSSGKSSFLLGVQEKYSKILGIQPTKGVNRSTIEIFGAKLVEWELGGQKHYRDAIQTSATILYGTDVLFFLVDGQNLGRLEEAIDFFRNILTFLKGNDIHVPIEVCIHKIDPDLREHGNTRANIEKVRKKFREITSDVHQIKFFETSIFDHWSLLQAFSYGVARLSPNREIAHLQLTHLAGKIHAEGLYLLNEAGLILSDYVQNASISEALEISVPHLFSIFKNFKKANMIQKDRVISKLDNRVVVLQKITVQKFVLYLVAQLSSEKDISVLDANLDDFVHRISDIVQNYL